MSTTSSALPYVDGFVAAVPAENKEAYLQHAALAAEAFKDMGALEIVETWEDDVPTGEHTCFPSAVKRQPGEIVVFSWICWPSREVRDAAHARMGDDPRLRDNPMPFDGKRLIYGGFQMLMRR